MKLTLLHKGLLLVGIPLCFELTIFAVLINLQDSIEREAQRLDRQNRIADALHVVLADTVAIADVVNMASYKTLYQSLHDGAAARDFADMQAHFKEIRELCSDDPELLKSADVAEEGVDLAWGDIQELKAKVRHADLFDLPKLARETGRRIDLHLNYTLEQGLPRLIQGNRASSNALSTSSMPQTIQIILKCGIAVSAILYIIGAFMLSGHLGRRLLQLAENARRLAAGKEQLAPLSGGDEIAQLDRTFHEAAEQVATAKRMRERLTALLAHDLKTPLRSIEQCLNKLADGSLGEMNEKGASFLSPARLAAEHMFGLIDSVGKLERLRTGDIELQTVKLDLTALVERCVQSVKVLADEKKIEFQCSLSDGEPISINGDEFWLEQVFVNVLSNAVKYSPAQTRVTVRCVSKNGNAEVSISDQGPGIPDSEKDLIFRRFHRVDSTAAVPGTGLGLPIAKELIEMHRGSICVESQVGQGSTFTIKLPLAGTPALAEKKDRVLSSQPAAKPRGLTLLHKGLLLVSIPLCFELTTFGILIHLQDQVEKENLKTNMMKKYNDAVDTTIRDGMGVALCLRRSTWRSLVASGRLQEYTTDMKKNMNTMREIERREGYAAQNIDMVEKTIDESAESFSQLKSEYQQAGPLSSQALDDRKRIEHFMDRTWRDALLKLSRIPHHRSEGDVESSRTRERIRVLLKCALGLSVMLAVAGAWLFGIHLVRRLSVLGKNAGRLGRGEPLLPLLSGSDEIVELDKNIHYAARLIEDAKRVRQEVTAMITHDLKTPLQTIRSYFELLGNGLFGELNAKGTALLSDAEKACEKMVDLIDSVLTLEKMRASCVKLDENKPDQVERVFS